MRGAHSTLCYVENKICISEGGGKMEIERRDLSLALEIKEVHMTCHLGSLEEVGKAPN